MKWYRIFKTIFSGGDHGNMKLEVGYPIAGGIDLKDTNVTTTGVITAGEIKAFTATTVAEAASGAINITKDYTILTAGTAAAYTLADADSSNTGTVITIVSTKAVANTVTATKFTGATMTADCTTATFGTTTAGNTITLVSNGTSWVCVTNVGVVFS